MRTRLAAATALTLAAGLVVLVVLGGGGPAAGRALPPYHPERLGHLHESRQVLVVTAARWRSTRATLRAYRQAGNGDWHLDLGPWKARLGYGGLARAATRRQGSGTTPAGTFRLGPGFGSAPDPGTGLTSYRHFDKNDYWVYDPRDPSTYNVLEPRRSSAARWRTSWAERLAHWGGRQYRYAAVVRFNLPRHVRWSARQRQYVADRPADTRRGGGIFLHVNGSGSTAGCVSVTRSHMRRTLRWLDSHTEPRIVIGPERAITRM